MFHLQMLYLLWLNTQRTGHQTEYGIETNKRWTRSEKEQALYEIGKSRSPQIRKPHHGLGKDQRHPHRNQQTPMLDRGSSSN